MIQISAELVNLKESQTFFTQPFTKQLSFLITCEFIVPLWMSTEEVDKKKLCKSTILLISNVCKPLTKYITIIS